MPEASHLITSIRGLFRLLEELGHSRQELLDMMGEGEDIFQRPLVRTSVAKSNAIWGLAFEHCGAQMGLKVARHGQPTDLQSIGNALSTSRDIKEAVQRLERFVSVMADLTDVKYQETQDSVEVSIAYQQTLPWMDERLEAIALLCRNIVSQWLDSPMQLKTATLTRSRPDDPAPWQHAFDCPLRWNGDKLVLQMSQQEASRPLLTHSPELHASSDYLLNKLLHDKEQQDPLAAVRIEILRQLETPDLKLEQIAEGMNLGVRSLQRRLSDQGTNFRELYKMMRMERAIQYLQQGKAAKEVAYQLGFHEPTVFHRAFKQWTGKTTSAYYPGASKRN